MNLLTGRANDVRVNNAPDNQHHKDDIQNDFVCQVNLYEEISECVCN
jgi:hypothetical protein